MTSDAQRIDRILDYWFTTGTDQAKIAGDQNDLWWGKGLDDELRERFLPELERAQSGELDGWAATPRGRLALIILLDQITRCVYRDTPAAFSGDPQALALSREAIASGQDRALRPIERVFVYLPLEHAEDRAAQAEAVAQFKALAAEVGDDLKKLFAYYLDFAEKHRAIIDRFGHFPHRNVILGRTATPAELEFLLEPGSSF